MSIVTAHYGIDRYTAKIIYLGVGPDTQETVQMLGDNATSVASFNGTPINLADVIFTLAEIIDMRNQLDVLLRDVGAIANEIVTHAEMEKEEKA